MEDIPSIGHRELCQEFESDRHALVLLAKAFEALSVANRPDLSNIHSVQTATALRRELLLLEEK